jgi:hypothetical protein
VARRGCTRSLGKVAYARTWSANIGDLVATVAGDCDAPIRRGGQLPGPVFFRHDRRASHRSGIVRLRRRVAQRSGMSGRIGPGGMGGTLVVASPLWRRFFPSRLRIMSDRLPNHPHEPTETSSCRRSIIKGASRISSCLRGSAHRSTMRHDVDMSASHHGGLRPKGSFDHGFHGWHGWDRTGARTSWHPCDPCDPWSTSLRGTPQNMRSSNQPHEPTETSSCRGSIRKCASRVTSCLRGSAHR